jgi:hypothetical protein
MGMNHTMNTSLSNPMQHPLIGSYNAFQSRGRVPFYIPIFTHSPMNALVGRFYCFLISATYLAARYKDETNREPSSSIHSYD